MREITRHPQPIACTLESDQVEDRVADWTGLLRAAVERVPVEGGLAIRFPLEPPLAAAVADLAAREQGCCAFFDFSLRMVPGALWLEVRAPEEALPIVTSLFGDGTPVE